MLTVTRSTFGIVNLNNKAKCEIHVPVITLFSQLINVSECLRRIDYQKKGSFFKLIIYQKYSFYFDMRT